MRVVELKTGWKVAPVTVTNVLHAMEELRRRDPIAFYEMVHLCRYENWRLWGDTMLVLRAWGLIGPDNRPHDDTRQIILSAVSGEGTALEMNSPLAGA